MAPRPVLLLPFPYPAPSVQGLVRDTRRLLEAVPGVALLPAPSNGSGGRPPPRMRLARDYVRTQLGLVRAVRDAPSDALLVFFLGPHWLLPAAVARSRRLRVLYLPGGLTWRRVGRRGSLLQRAARRLEEAALRRAHVVGLESREELPFLPAGVVGSRDALRFVDAPPAASVAPPSRRPARILFLGRLAPAKGIGLVLDAFERVAAEAELVVAGTGRLGPSVWRRSERDPRIRALGWVSEDEKRRWLLSSRLLVLPSRSEGVPTVVLEAMAHGAVVMATPVGGIPSLVRPGATGFLLEEPRPAAFASALEGALAHPGLDAIARRARALVLRRCSFPAARRRYVRMVRRALAKGP